MLLMTATNLFSVVVLRRIRILVRRNQSARPSSSSSARHALRPRAVAATGSREASPTSPRTAVSSRTAWGRCSPRVVVVIFSMVGAEVATIAAAETDDPERAFAERPTPSWPASRSSSSARSFCWCSSCRGIRWSSARRRMSPPSTRWVFPAPIELHERRRPDRGAVLPELRVSTPRRACCSCSPARQEAPAQLVKVSRRGVPYLAIVCRGGRLPVRRHGLALAGHGVPLPAQLLRRHRACSSTC